MIADIIEKIKLHQKRSKAALDEIVSWKTINSEIFNNFEKIKTIDIFIYRFIKLQDMMGEKLFKIFLDEIGEYKDNMSLLDILDKLEKFEIIKNAYDWMEYRKLRNQLTHEYPNNEDEIIEGIILAIDVYKEIDTIFNNIIRYHDERLK